MTRKFHYTKIYIPGGNRLIQNCYEVHVTISSDHDYRVREISNDISYRVCRSLNFSGVAYCDSRLETCNSYLDKVDRE